MQKLKELIKELEEYENAIAVSPKSHILYFAYQLVSTCEEAREELTKQAISFLKEAGQKCPKCPNKNCASCEIHEKLTELGNIANKIY